MYHKRTLLWLGGDSGDAKKFDLNKLFSEFGKTKGYYSENIRNMNSDERREVFNSIPKYDIVVLTDPFFRKYKYFLNAVRRFIDSMYVEPKVLIITGGMGVNKELIRTIGSYVGFSLEKRDMKGSIYHLVFTKEGMNLITNIKEIFDGYFYHPRYSNKYFSPLFFSGYNKYKIIDKMHVLAIFSPSDDPAIFYTEYGKGRIIVLAFGLLGGSPKPMLNWKCIREKYFKPFIKKLFKTLIP